MATMCDACSFRENEVKGGSGIEPKGKKITLKLTDPTDLTRDVLKVRPPSYGLIVNCIYMQYESAETNIKGCMGCSM